MWRRTCYVTGVSNRVTTPKNAVTATPVTYARESTRPVSMMRTTKGVEGEKAKYPWWAHLQALQMKPRQPRHSTSPEGANHAAPPWSFLCGCPWPRIHLKNSMYTHCWTLKVTAHSSTMKRAMSCKHIPNLWSWNLPLCLERTWLWSVKGCQDLGWEATTPASTLTSPCIYKGLHSGELRLYTHSSIDTQTGNHRKRQRVLHHPYRFRIECCRLLDTKFRRNRHKPVSQSLCKGTSSSNAHGWNQRPRVRL